MYITIVDDYEATQTLHLDNDRYELIECLSDLELIVACSCGKFVLPSNYNISIDKCSVCFTEEG
jgi:hypothetical protein